MIKNIFLLLLVFESAISKEWDKRFDELCSYDLTYCANLKNSSGEWKRPAKEMVIALKSLSDVINKASLDFGVDARAIAGCILAENSLNVSLSDGIQDWLVKSKIAGKGSVLGKKFSFGWGQLYMDAATEAEPLMAKIEGRSVRSSEDIAQALLRPEDAIRYVAAVLRHIQDNYKSQGIDISSRPEILATVYNLGNSLNRAKKAKELGKDPKINNFGFFVEMYLDVISGIVDEQISEEKLKNQEYWDYLKPKGFLSSFFKDSRKKELARRVTTNLHLVHAPPVCSIGGNESNKDLEKSSTLKFSRPSGFLKSESGFRVISKNLDCDLNEWRLIEDESGKIKGWVSLEDIENNSRPSDILQICRTDTLKTNKCLEKLKTFEGFTILENDDGIIKAKLVGRKEKVDWKKPFVARRCGKVDKKVKAPKTLSAQEIKKLNSGIQEFKSSLLIKLQLNKTENIKFSDYSNPYNFIEEELEFNRLSRCSHEYDVEKNLNKCSGDVESFIKKLNQVFIKKNPKWSDIKKARDYIEKLKGEISIIQRDFRSESLTLDKIKVLKENILFCKDNLKNYPNAFKIMLELESQINNPGLHSIFTYNEYKIEKMKKLCENFNKAFEFSDEELKKCFNCNLRIYIGSQNVTNITNFSYQIMRQMLTNDKERDEFLIDQLNHLRFDINKSISQVVSKMEDEADCSYDQVQTTKLIETILKEQCVQEVYVPDSWLINHLYRSGNERLPILKSFIEDDRFEIDLKERKLCSE